MKKILLKNRLLLTLFVGLLLRLISIDQSLWLDEATTALAAKMPLADIFTKFLPGDFHPPLYYLLMKGWGSLFGLSEISLRTPSVIFGILTIYFIYLIAKKIFDTKTARIASILAATSGLLIYYSQEARMYSLAAFLATLLFYLFLEKKWVLFSIFLPILAMTDYVSLLIIPVFWLLGYKDWKKLALAHIPLFIILIAWLPTFLSQLSGGFSVQGSAWWNLLGTISLKNIALIPVKFIFGRISFNNKILYGAVSLASAFLYAFLLTLRRPLKGFSHKVLWAWLIVPILLSILISIKIPILYYFRFLFCLPAFYILAAGGLTSLKGKTFWIFLSTAILINIASSSLYLFNPKFQRENWRAVAEAVGADAIIYPSNSQKEALTYYQKGGQIVYFQNFSGEPRVVWLSRYVWQIFDSKDMARIKIENLGYNKVQELNLNGVEFWKYIK
ncbi:MAG: hypothetical protein ACD_13C00144G0041 [uncultured bacterium]|nr:MAG: hypothetical protein ACD_13C00144G0041 [uncultured bacterium]KKR56473.1 MAG: hypothetical protein UT96_C0043G0007 [Candidatus Woesebacteria bacterium GW2011_GWC2_40_30]HAU65335.1 hypothetical protein [Candidatus Woesebacteria bacterium]HCC09181.1 hypothetical protein [Candidatus Woesebacteria bacterium]